MSQRMKRYLKYLLFTVLGAGLGFAYYYFIGCRTGTCPIQASPFKMPLFGAVIGFLVGNIIW